MQVIRADIRDAEARRRALDGAEAVVHLAAIVGDPACARDPEVSDDVNVRPRARSSQTPTSWRRAPGVRLDLLELRAHGRPERADHRGGRAAPVSLYAEQKVGMEQADPR